MVQTHDHEIVSIYPFTDAEVDTFMELVAERMEEFQAGRRADDLTILVLQIP